MLTACNFGSVLGSEDSSTHAMRLLCSATVYYLESVPVKVCLACCFFEEIAEKGMYISSCDCYCAVAKGYWPTVSGLLPQLEVIKLLSAVCRCTPCSRKQLIASDSMCTIRYFDYLEFSERKCRTLSHGAGTASLQPATIST